MFEINVRILHRTVFLPKESIQCELTVTNVGKKNKLENPNDLKQKGDTLAWASAQIYCLCSLNNRKLKLPASMLKNDTQDVQKTSFIPMTGESGSCLHITDAQILFCELYLKKGESRKFVYTESLPVLLPPSYKGYYVKFSYKISIGIGRINNPLHVIRLPFTLYEIKGVYKAFKEKCCDALPMERLVERESINPFNSEATTEKHSVLDIGMDVLMHFTMKKNLNTYNIQSEKGVVGKFSLSKHYYRLGEDILGTFDFYEATVPCIKFTVSLQVEETISKHCVLQPYDSTLVHYSTLSQHEECTMACMKTNFALPIPISSTMEFTHKIVSISWRLHFEFIVTPPPDVPCIPSRLAVEPMHWNLPIHVVATNPIQASIMLQTNASQTFILDS